jgi:hypothetical protein
MLFYLDSSAWLAFGREKVGHGEQTPNKPQRRNGWMDEWTEEEWMDGWMDGMWIGNIFSLYYYCMKPNHCGYACTKLSTCIDYLPT